MLRYPGGKLRLQKKINEMIADFYPDSNSDWVVGEPFTGGGGSLINMAERFPKWKFHINDANPQMYKFWRFFVSASDKDMEKFYKRLEDTKPTLKSYNDMFDSKPRSDFDSAFRIFFLNKTSFGGYVTQKLPIGGKEQKSKWKVDVYWTPKNMIKKIKRMRDSIKGRILSVNMEDCNDFMKKHGKSMDFMYADPPYIKYGKQWYKCDFDMQSLRDFRDSLDGIPRWCISMDSLKETDALFSKDDMRTVPVKHTAKSMGKGNEIKEAKELVVFPNNT